jgi:hypothetical protein
MKPGSMTAIGPQESDDVQQRHRAAARFVEAFKVWRDGKLGNSTGKQKKNMNEANQRADCIGFACDVASSRYVFCS